KMLGAIQGRLPRVPAVAGRAFRARADDRADFAVRLHDAQRVPAPFQDIDPALPIHRHRARVYQRAGAGVGPVLRHAALPVARNSRYDARLHVYDPDAAVLQVGQVEMLGLAVEGEAVDAVELRLGRRATVSAEPVLPRPGCRRDDAGPVVYSAHAAVERIRDI